MLAFPRFPSQLLAACRPPPHSSSQQCPRPNSNPSYPQDRPRTSERLPDPSRPGSRRPATSLASSSQSASPPALLLAGYELTSRPLPPSRFLGTFVIVFIGDGVVAQYVLSGGSHGSWLGINVACLPSSPPYRPHNHELLTLNSTSWTGTRGWCCHARISRRGIRLWSSSEPCCASCSVAVHPLSLTALALLSRSRFASPSSRPTALDSLGGSFPPTYLRKWLEDSRLLPLSTPSTECVLHQAPARLNSH